MARVELQDSPMEAIIKMVEGNPGALRVSIEIINREKLGLIHYLKLDEEGIYGPRIWMCYKDLCGEDIDTLYDLLKHNKLLDAIRVKCKESEYFRKEWEFYKTT